ncbi:conserved hypothethical protein (plasmid) [Ralstonia solanacearum CMR15]|nr:conserved hypothethical protein [Ralstonia solanacearum CMR15]
MPSQTVSFAYLKDEAPAPFKEEVDVGAGRHLHHKFVVCDFNGAQPVVFCGASNLSRGGEERNGDSLIAIHDPAIVTAYAIEAIRLFDHDRFRASQSKATPRPPAGDEGDRCVGRPILLFAQSTAEAAAPA